MMKHIAFCLASAFALVSCCCKDPLAALKPHMRHTASFTPSDCFLVILVDARQLDYSGNKSFFRSMVKHPSDGSKNSDVGHAWIYLKGIENGVSVELEGGHSGERGRRCPKYFEGVMNYCEYGYENPGRREMMHPRFEPNPIKYLWASLDDGFFQEGAGCHVPTFAVKIDLSSETFEKILCFVRDYPYEKYSLTERQCCSFVREAAAIAGLPLYVDYTMKIEPFLRIAGSKVLLWTDLEYSELTFPCPEKLEFSMAQAVMDGHAEYALDWYLACRSRCTRQPCVSWNQAFMRLHRQFLFF